MLVLQCALPYELVLHATALVAPPAVNILPVGRTVHAHLHRSACSCPASTHVLVLGLNKYICVALESSGLFPPTANRAPLKASAVAHSSGVSGKLCHGEANVLLRDKCTAW